MSDTGGIGGGGGQPMIDITGQGSAIDDEAASSVSEEVAGEDSSKTATTQGKKKNEAQTKGLGGSSATQQAETVVKDEVQSAGSVEKAKEVMLQAAAQEFDAASPGLAAPSSGGGHGGGNVWMQTDAMVGAIVAALSSVRLMAESRREDQSLKTDMAIQVSEMKEAAALMQREASIDKAEAQIIEGQMQIASGFMQVAAGATSGAMAMGSLGVTMKARSDTRKANKLDDTNERTTNDKNTLKNENYALSRAEKGQTKAEIERQLQSDSSLSKDDKAQIQEFMDQNSALFGVSQKNNNLNGKKHSPMTPPERQAEIKQRQEPNNDIISDIDAIQKGPYTEKTVDNLSSRLTTRETLTEGSSPLETNNATTTFTKSEINDTNRLKKQGNKAIDDRSGLQADGLSFKKDANGEVQMPGTLKLAKVRRERGMARQEMARATTQVAQSFGQMLTGTGTMFGGLGSIMAGYKNIEAAETQYGSDLCRAMADLMEAHLRVVDQDIEDFRQGVNKGLETLQGILNISKSSANMRG